MVQAGITWNCSAGIYLHIADETACPCGRGWRSAAWNCMFYGRQKDQTVLYICKNRQQDRSLDPEIAGRIKNAE